MKLKKLFLFLCVSSFLAVSFTSCSDDDPVVLEPIETIREGAYILNSGGYGNNDASIAAYDFATKAVYTNVFWSQNKKKILGDTGQDLLVYGSKVYTAVYNSNTIFITDKNLKVIDSIKPMRNNQPSYPRYLAASGGKVYVTLFDGYLAQIDTATLKIEKQVQVGRNPENVVYSNNKLYVANSGGMAYPANYDHTVSVVDVATLTVSKSIQVVQNPRLMQTDNQGDIYLISMSDYMADDAYSLQRIDTKTDESEVIPSVKAAFFASSGTKLYIVYSTYGIDPKNIKYTTYDAINEKVLSEQFITDGTLIQNPNGINVDPSTGNIYIADALDFKTTGNMYVLSSEGKLLKKFDTGSIGPVGAHFFKK